MMESKVKWKLAPVIASININLVSILALLYSHPNIAITTDSIFTFTGARIIAISVPIITLLSTRNYSIATSTHQTLVITAISINIVSIVTFFEALPKDSISTLGKHAVGSAMVIIIQVHVVTYLGHEIQVSISTCSSPAVSNTSIKIVVVTIIAFLAIVKFKDSIVAICQINNTCTRACFLEKPLTVGHKIIFFWSLKDQH